MPSLLCERFSRDYNFQDDNSEPELNATVYKQFCVILSSNNPISSLNVLWV